MACAKYVLYIKGREENSKKGEKIHLCTKYAIPSNAIVIRNDQRAKKIYTRDN